MSKQDNPKKELQELYNIGYLSANEVYSLLDSDDKKWNNKKAKPLTEVYNEVLNDFNQCVLRKSDPKTMLALILEELKIYGTVRVSDEKGATVWLIEQKFKEDIFIPNKDITIENFDIIKEKIKTAKYIALL